MKYLRGLITILKFLTGSIFALFIVATLFIAMASGPDMGTEANGYFNVLLVADLVFGIVFLIVYKADKRMKEKQNSY